MRRLFAGVAVLLVPCAVWAQSAAPPPPADATATAAKSTGLPPILVPVPKQRPKRATQAKRPPAKRAPPAPLEAPATTVAAPADSTVGAPGNPDEMVSVSPIAGGGVPRDKVPANAQVVGAAAFDHALAPDLLQAMSRALAGVSLSDQTGNQFQLDLNYRGFTASPVIGTPQGLAVYQNGVRINEVFGDIVNWDFIPETAINRMELLPGNPVFGLNALGGAISIQMKNGFTYQGVEGEARFGSYGREGFTAQAGGQNDNIAAYVAADSINDQGWREYSPSRVERLYADIGARGEEGEFHVTFTGADNFFGATAATPGQLLAQNWASVYTVPQTTENSLAFLTASLSYKPTDTLALQGLAYYRGFWQTHVDGNGTAAQNQGCPDPTVLCFPNLDGTLSNLITTSGQTVPNTGLLAASVLGEIDRTWTTTNSFGGSLQATSTDKAFGHPNNLVIGASLDRGYVQFTSNGELGTINPNQFPVVYGVGLIIDQPNGDDAPVSLHAYTTYLGVYAIDTFDVTSRLTLTAGARYNIALITLEDELGTALNGFDEYLHFNPVVGATYKIATNVTAYGSFAESNRAPTPLELACSDPIRPCLIDSFLVADPSLKQVVGYTFEGGLRGTLGTGPAGGQLAWSLGAFHTLSENDIIMVASPLPGHGYFQNAGETLREGIEAAVKYKWDRWTAYANYTFIDARFESVELISSPNNPMADANGNILVTPGDHIPAIPRYRIKAGAEYAVTDAWKIGADLNVVGSQYLAGDQSNQNPEVPAYWVVNAHTSYRINKNLEAFGLVQNLFNQRYYTYGLFFQTDSFPYLNLTDPRSFLPGMPLAAYAGVRATW